MRAAGRETSSRGGVLAMREDLWSFSETDDELRSMFDEWAKKYNKVYGSVREKEALYAIFLSRKKYVNKSHSLGPPYNNVELNHNSDRRLCELPVGRIGGWGTNPPDFLKAELDFDPKKTGMSCEELKEAMIEFEKWKAKHGKVYVSEKEREKRLMIFWKNKKYIDGFLRKHGEFWTHGGYDGDLDLMWWEIPRGP